MFGINLKMKPQQIFGMMKTFGIDPKDILPKIEDALLEEAEKIERETGKRVCLLAAPVGNGTEHGKSIRISFLLEGDQPGKFDTYKSFPFSEILNFFSNFENDIKNEHTSEQRSIGAGAGEPGTGQYSSSTGSTE